MTRRVGAEWRLQLCGLLFVLPVHTLATSGKRLERAMHCPAGKLIRHGDKLLTVIKKG